MAYIYFCFSPEKNRWGFLGIPAIFLGGFIPRKKNKKNEKKYVDIILEPILFFIGNGLKNAVKPPNHFVVEFKALISFFFYFESRSLYLAPSPFVKKPCGIFAKKGKVCAEKTMIQIDHIQPFALGGKTTTENLQLLCRTHNLYRAQLTFGCQNFPPESAREA